MSTNTLIFCAMVMVLSGVVCAIVGNGSGLWLLLLLGLVIGG